MKLDFLEDINEYHDHLLRLYDFSTAEAQQLKDAIQLHLIENKTSLDLHTLGFVESHNCRLIFHLAEEDEGLMTQDNELFFCDLTKEGYQRMIYLIEPFCKKESRAHQYLYDLDNPIDFLFAPNVKAEF
jgi:hypothetical protein